MADEEMQHEEDLELQDEDAAGVKGGLAAMYKGTGSSFIRPSFDSADSSGEDEEEPQT